MPEKLRREHVASFDQLLSRVDTAPLSELLPAVLRIAKLTGRNDLSRWARLEVDGYFRGNPAMGEDVTVPEYRAVPGQYYDDVGNRLVVEDTKLHFIFEDRLRFGVRELEQLALRPNEIRVQRTASIETVRQHLNVSVTTYGFPPSAVLGVLAAIRSELVDRLGDLEREMDMSRNNVSIAPPAADRSNWIARHVWPIIVTLATGLLVAYISHLMGWL